ncbi:MAG: T9SS type A sorting domain-containing protein [Bacteroidetes bacterium]|nr:T9SS type A sorting domain-containing protein [Bacteroidota bacterium]
MLKKLTLLVLSLTTAVFFTSTMMSDNGKAGKTGSPGELTCIDCHGDFAANSGGGSIAVSGITGGTYTPGTTYNLSVVIARTGSSLFGLGFEALTAANANAGTLTITNATQTQLKSATVSGVSRQSVVHQLNGGATSNTHTFTFNWTAPAAGAGNVTFYFAGVACDNDGNESGDYVYNSSLVLTEGGGCLPPAQPGTITGTAAVCAGSTQTYSVAAVSGATDYIWTKPSGWTGTSTTSSITVTAGSTGGAITVAAHNACGTSTVRSMTLTVNPSAAPAVSIATNPGSTICSGTSVTFTATPTNNGTTPAYQWKLNGANVGTNSATYTNAALTNGNTVSCVMTSNSACASTPTATSNTVTMTVSSSVAPSVSIAANPGSTICSGTSVTFTATPTNGGTTPAYQWKLNGANVGTNSATYTNAALTNGNTVSCVMTSNSACATTPTATSNTITMTIAASVDPTISIVADPGNSICTGSNVTFTATPTNGGTSPAYQWTLNNVNVGTNSATYSNNALVSGDQIQCTLTSNSTCASPNTVISQIITMTVNSSFTPTITPNGATTFCAGGNVILSVSTGSSYLWSNGATTQTITVASAGSYSVAVTSGTCSGTATAIDVTVNPLPTVTMASLSPVCATDAPFALTGGSPAGGTYSGNGVTSGTFDPAAAGVGTTIITYTYSDALSCSNTATTNQVVTNCGGGGCTTAPNRPSRISGPTFVICGSTGIVYSVNPDTAATSYTWTVPANAVITANNGNSITVDFIQGFTSGSICVTATNACGTSDDRCKFVHQVSMRVPPIHGPREICPDNYIGQYSIQPVVGAVSYAWTVTGGASITSIDNNATVDFTNATSSWVLVSVSVTNACGNVRSRTFLVHVQNDCDGDDDDDDDDDDDRMANRISSFEIYPNPNAGEFAIQVSSSADANAEISIVDMIGKTQFTFTQVIDQGINTINVNASHLSKGIYFMKISIPGMPVEMKQVVIQN